MYVFITGLSHFRVLTFQYQRKLHSLLYDAKLYILFHDFIASLSESARASQITEQRKWLTTRKAQIHESYSEYEGGTLASYSAGRASIDATKKRIAEIEKRMKELPTKI